MAFTPARLHAGFLYALTATLDKRRKPERQRSQAILDRFLQDAELIEITGRSYRLAGRTGASAKPAKPDHRVGEKKSTNEARK